MSGLPVFHRAPFLLLCILGVTLMTSGFPQPRLPFSSSVEPKQDGWNILFPSISLRDWSIQMMSEPSLGPAANNKARLMREAWLSVPEEAETSLETVWPAEWFHGTRMVKRNMVVADDAAFREKSKLLTAMERQKWLNSYMQKLLVVNS
uniref:Tuberoinfundibular peptide of 39 residues n=1 Tax=Myripristis murdjan TaxID=586833 RepID=A0A667Y4M2_9TELE